MFRINKRQDAFVREQKVFLRDLPWYHRDMEMLCRLLDVREGKRILVEDETFDAVISKDTFEHIWDAERSVHGLELVELTTSRAYNNPDNVLYGIFKPFTGGHVILAVKR